MTKDTGGQAFATIKTEAEVDRRFAGGWSNTFSVGGMTLRDYFAGHALMGWYSGGSCLPSTTHLTGYAKQFYEMADAMIAERNKCSE